MNNSGRLDGPAYAFGDPSNGKPITFAEITDGTETTAMFSEWTLGTPEDQRRTGPIYRSTDPDSRPIPLDTLAANCAASTSVVWQTKGGNWLSQDCGKGGGYSHIMTPNAQACFFSNVGFTWDRTMIGASSHHPGGVNVGMANGSVRFVKDGVNPAIWRALSTIAGGETINLESF